MRVVGKATKGIVVVQRVSPSQGQDRLEEGAQVKPLGKRTKAIAAEIEKLEAARTKVVKEEAQLARQVADRQTRLDSVRAEGLLGAVDQGQLAAFEGELADLKVKLDEARSALAGFDQLLAEKRQDLASAKVADAQAAVETAKFAEIRKAMETNAAAMAKAHAAFLEALETGAAELIETARPRWDEWHELLDERRGLYHRRVQATGGLSDPDRQLRLDPLSKLFADNYADAEVLGVVEMLLPLVVISFGWPAVRCPRR